MKSKSLLFSVLFSFCFGAAPAQDLISGGNNSWIFHTPDHNNNTWLYIAPYRNGDWDWSKQTAFADDGQVIFSNSIYTYDIVSQGSNSWFFQTPDDGRSELFIVPAINGNWDFNKATTFYNNGQVLFGSRKPTTDNDWKLAVDGKIMSSEVKVTAPDLWADYVFSPGYPLLPLEEVERYVLKNKHLPDIPSAAQVAQNGLDLGQMEALLLKKVEELTLYMIELKKENNSLKTANQEMRSKLDDLARQLKQTRKP